jgi:hypothetical protein
MLRSHADTDSPWYEAYTAPRRVPPAAWLASGAEEAPPAEEPAPADDQSATDAIFDYYNG